MMADRVAAMVWTSGLEPQIPPGQHVAVLLVERDEWPFGPNARVLVTAAPRADDEAGPPTVVIAAERVAELEDAERNLIALRGPIRDVAITLALDCLELADRLKPNGNGNGGPGSNPAPSNGHGGRRPRPAELKSGRSGRQRRAREG